MTKLKRFSVRLPVSTYNQIKRDAKRHGITMAEYGRRAIAWHLAHRHKLPPIVSEL